MQRQMQSFLPRRFLASQNHIQDSGPKVDLREEPVYGALQFPLQLINNHNTQNPKFTKVLM